MRKSSAFGVAAISSLLLVAPGLVQTSSAEGSAFAQKKANDAYQALSVEPPTATTEAAPAVIAPRTATRPAATVGQTMVPDETVHPWTPMYDAPRGGREY